MPIIIRGPVLACLALQMRTPDTQRPQNVATIPLPKLSSRGRFGGGRR